MSRLMEVFGVRIRPRILGLVDDQGRPPWHPNAEAPFHLPSENTEFDGSSAAKAVKGSMPDLEFKPRVNAETFCRRMANDIAAMRARRDVNETDEQPAPGADRPSLVGGLHQRAIANRRKRNSTED